MVEASKNQLNCYRVTSKPSPTAHHKAIPINKAKVLRRMEEHYKKVDPAFRIKHYILENQVLVE